MNLKKKKSQNQQQIQKLINNLSLFLAQLFSVINNIATIRSIIDLVWDNDNIEKKILQRTNIDIDSIELNSLRQEFDNLVDFYTDGIINLGYIFLFAVAFPIGPLIAVAAITLEISTKLTVFLDIYKRPPAKVSIGIGIWLNYWEYLNFFSILSNFGLIYLSSQESDYLYEIVDDKFNTNYQSNTLNQQWLIIQVIGFFIAISSIISKFIVNGNIKPQWILDEEEHRNFIQTSIEKKEQDEQDQVEKKLQDDNNKQKEQLDKIDTQIQQIKTNYDKQLKILNEQINYYKQFVSKKNYLQEALNEKEITEKKQKLLRQKLIMQRNQMQHKKNIYQYQMLGILKNTFIAFEHQLLLARLKELISSSSELTILCNTCNSYLAVFYCVQCQEDFCALCLYDSHINNPHKQLAHLYKYLREEFSNESDELEYIKQNYFLTQQSKGINSLGSNEQKTEVLKQHQQIQEQKKFYKDFLQGAYDGDLSDACTWKKFQQFNFSVLKHQELSESYQQLEAVYSIFYEEYIENNGFIENVQEGEQVDQLSFDQINKVFRVTILNQFQKNETIYRAESRAFEELDELVYFNIEEKLFFNRIAFIIFKQYGCSATFQDFLKYVEILQMYEIQKIENLLQQKSDQLQNYQSQDKLQENNNQYNDQLAQKQLKYVQKYDLFLQLINENEDNLLFPEQLRNLLIPSFVQDNKLLSGIDLTYTVKLIIKYFFSKMDECQIVVKKEVDQSQDMSSRKRQKTEGNSIEQQLEIKQQDQFLMQLKMCALKYPGLKSYLLTFLQSKEIEDDYLAQK